MQGAWNSGDKRARVLHLATKVSTGCRDWLHERWSLITYFRPLPTSFKETIPN
jgi:hypothetical protein